MWKYHSRITFMNKSLYANKQSTEVNIPNMIRLFGINLDLGKTGATHHTHKKLLTPC